MQNRTFPRKPVMPLPKPQGIGEETTGLITAFIRIVDEISREHPPLANRDAER